jgi:hypothetical protein
MQEALKAKEKFIVSKIYQWTIYASKTKHVIQGVIVSTYALQHHDYLLKLNIIIPHSSTKHTTIFFWIDHWDK